LESEVFGFFILAKMYHSFDQNANLWIIFILFR